MCDLCKHEQNVPGHMLCPVCLEAVIRLSVAVKGMEQEATRQPAASTATNPFGNTYFEVA